MNRACFPTYLRPPRLGLRVGGSFGAGRKVLRLLGYQKTTGWPVSPDF